MNLCCSSNIIKTSILFVYYINRCSLIVFVYSSADYLFHSILRYIYLLWEEFIFDSFWEVFIIGDWIDWIDYGGNYWTLDGLSYWSIDWANECSLSISIDALNESEPEPMNHLLRRASTHLHSISLQLMAISVRTKYLKYLEWNQAIS